MIVAQADTPNILSCLYDRYFWIGWTNTTVSIGRNTQAFKGAVVTWMDTNVKSITGVCISSNNNPGTWALNSLPG
jgi:Farnesoic acid 0-methyl transferase